MKEPLNCKNIIAKKNGVEVDGILYSHIVTNNFGIHCKGCIDLTGCEKDQSIFAMPKFKIPKISPQAVFNISCFIAIMYLQIELFSFEDRFKAQYHKLQTVKEWCITHNKLDFCEDFFK